MQGLKNKNLISRIWFSFFAISLLVLAGCQAKPQGLSAEQIAALQEQGFKLTDNGWEFGLANKVLFGSDVRKLNPTGVTKVQNIGKALAAVGITHLRVDGHTDSTGEDSYNQQLSYQRALAVADTLASTGIPRQNIDVRGRGKLDPVADNRTAKGRAENRRVSMIVTAP
ncbi:OmpA family protein [Yersinia aleksiciae]|uniref:Membrane protein n=1 Tax=Yersinia aleksiciae TaxID=263819 RepID=A0ABM5UEE4_YERAE|nr:OmpA family protein [Yersinia aleksiciae]AKP34221.1 membrane protein [Yersinia aleksiciae]MDA5498844.1 OmpA family protein [Yersinia aleksiciae]NIK98604.1 OmpA family protein [Yersinia aleksiciae]WQC70213.1 OmpA family protein [Yersinia aleksiciae]CFQ35631.1 putative lipoprotein [Yersinia aleksiciae]